VKSLVLALVLLGGCASTTRLVTRRCPVPVTAVLADFFAGVGAFAVSSLKSNAGKTGESVAYTSVGVVLIGGAFMSEFSCMRRVK
jgi:hypothetical protein